MINKNTIDLVLTIDSTFKKVINAISKYTKK